MTILAIARGIQKASHRVERTPAALLHWPLFWLATTLYGISHLAQRLDNARIEAARAKRRQS